VYNLDKSGILDTNGKVDLPDTIFD